MSAILFLFGAAAGAGVRPGESFWMPPPGSSVAAEVDSIFYFIFWVALFFFFLIVSLMAAFVLRYRRREGAGPRPSAEHSLALELTWSVIPAIILVFTFHIGFKSFMNLNTPPANAYEILVTGQKWAWLFTYSNGYVDENLHAPQGRPVVLVMTSEDVIHSLFIPDFRVKNDAVPGRYSKVWFAAKDAGEHDIYCAEYCGTGHSTMHARVIVHRRGEFEKWLEDASNFLDRMTPAEGGERIFRARGCAQCHSVDGRPGIGPSLKNVFGAAQPLKDGGSAVADENYLRESIMEPMAKVVAGYDPVMPTFKGRLKDREITALIEFMKTLSDKKKE